MRELLTNLNRLSHIYDQLDLLNFRAHKNFPLTFNKEDSKALLPQNKRLYFSYAYLNKEKTRLTNLVLNQVIDLRASQFKNDSTIHPQLIDKVLRLKNLDQDHREKNFSLPTRNRKINKLKQLIAMIDDEQINPCRGYLNQIYVILLLNNLLPL